MRICPSSCDDTEAAPAAVWSPLLDVDDHQAFIGSYPADDVAAATAGQGSEDDVAAHRAASSDWAASAAILRSQSAER